MLSTATQFTLIGLLPILEWPWSGLLKGLLCRHLVHEVTSPQAFKGLCNAGRTVCRPDCTLATIDHVALPTAPPPRLV